MRLSRVNVGFGLMAFAAAVFGQHPEGTLEREGKFWVQKLSGSERLTAHSRLRVHAPGNVTLQGGPEEELSYSLIRRVKARSEGEARRRLASGAVRFQVHGDAAVLTVLDGSGTAELRLTGPRALRDVVVTTAGGNLETFDLKGSLNVETGGGRLKVDRIGGNLTARTAGGTIECGSVGGWVRCMSAGGAIRAGTIRGEAFFETGAGDIVVQEVAGPVRASTAGGGIRIMRAGGPVIADTAGGPIQVGAATGVKCESAGGAIRLTNVSGSLHAATAVGNIIAQLLAGQPLAESFLTTGAGDIVVFIPSNLGVRIRAHIEAGGNQRRFVSDFPGIAVHSEGSAVIAEGAINGGGPLLRLTGTAGSIFIRRQ